MLRGSLLPCPHGARHAELECSQLHGAEEQEGCPCQHCCVVTKGTCIHSPLEKLVRSKGRRTGDRLSSLFQFASP